MCFSIRFLKSYLMFSSITTGTAGLAIFIYSISNLTHSLEFFGEAKETRQNIMITLICFGVMLIICSSLGIFSSRKRKNYGILIYNIGLFIGFISFFIIGILSISLFDTLMEDGACENLEWLADYRKMENEALVKFC